MAGSLRATPLWRQRILVIATAGIAMFGIVVYDCLHLEAPRRQR
jgi:hypothetical protein